MGSEEEKKQEKVSIVLNTDLHIIGFNVSRKSLNVGYRNDVNNKDELRLMGCLHVHTGITCKHPIMIAMLITVYTTYHTLSLRINCDEEFTVRWQWHCRVG